MAGSLHQRRLVRLVAVACLLWTGCFYIDPINERPTATISCHFLDLDNARVCNPNDHIRRGETVHLEVVVTDPDGDEKDARTEWRAYRCAEPDGSSCSPDPYDEQSSDEADITAPEMPSGERSIRVDFDVRDGRGALVPTFAVYRINDAPTLELATSARSYVVGAPISLFAKYGDPDDGPHGVLPLQWEVRSPSGKRVEPEDFPLDQNGSDLDHRTVRKLLVPGNGEGEGEGVWTVTVTATDSFEEAVEKSIPVTVGPDQPPCLERLQPLVPPDGVSLPIGEPTRFQALLVSDDLDPYPPVSEPLFGTTRFAWSILPPGASVRQPLVGAGNAVDFDPRAFTPGEIVELRVEIFDRISRTIPCADDVPACSVTPQPGCVQRQTWRVEVR